MKPPLRIGIAGLGTVGGGTLELLTRNAALIAQRAGRIITVVAVSARDEAKARALPLAGARFVADASSLAADPEVDAVVEVIGGAEGVARKLVEAALQAGKPVITANKALIAHHGLSLAKMAEQSGTMLAFEAAVAGGIPIIKSLRDGLAANHFTRVAGILNGTCNYILTRMERERQGFEPVLADAQKLGYAEAEPSFDVDGIDAAHKIAILAGLAFGAAPAIDKVHVEGIRRISLRDMEFARELGYRIKLLAIAELRGGGIAQRVHPCLVPMDAPLANVHDVYNAIVAEGDAVGKVFFEGRGAGAGPTASSIVADIMDVARGATYMPFTLPTGALQRFPYTPMSELRAAYYLRLSVIDKPGVLAEITGFFRDHDISVRSFLQHSCAEKEKGEGVQVVITTHETQESAMSAALTRIASLPFVHEQPCVIRIENL